MQGGPDAQAPFHGEPARVNAESTTSIQAEDFDLGGEGVAYQTAGGSSPGNYDYRGFELPTGYSLSRGYNLHKYATIAGSWVEYTVDVAAAGQYDLTALVVADDVGASFHVELGGQDVTGRMDVPHVYQGHATDATFINRYEPVTAEGVPSGRGGTCCGSCQTRITGVTRGSGSTRSPWRPQERLPSPASPA